MIKSDETIILQWDFKEKESGDDVFVNVDGENTNVIDLIKGRERTVLQPNPLNPGTYTLCLTASVGELVWS